MAYHVVVRPERSREGAIDHSAAIYLMDRNGHFASVITHDDDDAKALTELRKLIA